MNEIDEIQKRANFHAELEGWLSVCLNILLFAVKVWVGVTTRSVAIMADAWHTLSDSISSIIVIAGVKISRKPADEEHPYGHGRAETIAALIIGVLLALISMEFFWEGIQKLKGGKPTEFDAAAYWVMALSVVLKEAMAQYSIRVGKKYNLNILTADGWHHRSDAITSLIIIIAIFFGSRFWWIDGALGIVVATVLLYAAWDIVRHAVDPILGNVPTKETIEQIKAICHRYCDGEIYVHHFHLHDYGGHKEITFHLKLPGEMPLDEAHEYTVAIERALRKEFNIFATIHMEPLKHKRH